ncbi:MAG: hypothetical protein K2M76_07905, partial [Muribaculaceae bacterium]|nr:hypothetical protein [Muribaculaceae bacterium]
EKIRQWTANAPKRAPESNALLMCDSGDDNSHIHFICKMAMAIDALSAGSTTVTKAYPQLHEFAINSKSDMPAIRKTITTALTHGTGLMLYAGHCDVTRLGQEYIWRTSDATTIHTPVPVAMLATCDALSADRHSTDIARAMLFNPRGGAMGVIGACRAVLQPFNEEFAADVVKALYTADKPLNLGDLYHNARTSAMARAIAASNLRLAVNTMAYALAGDPAIPIYNPHISITATTADNGLVAGGLNRISGGTDPGIDAVEVTVYAAPDTVLTYARKPYAAEPVRIDSRVLTRTTIAVNDGKFDSEFYLPASAKTAGPLRITLHASGNKGFASGVISDVAVNETSELNDSIRNIAPEITEFTVSESGRSTVSVHAVIDGGPTGVAMTGQPGMITHMKLDKDKIMPGTDASLLPMAGGKAELDYTIEDVTDGNHTLTLTTYTAAGAVASATTEFTVVNVDNITIDTDSAAVANEAIINVNPALPDDTESELMITDMNGTAVLYVPQPNLPFIWDLTNNDGEPVATGRYQVTIMTRRGHRHGASSRATVTVIRDHNN